MPALDAAGFLVAAARFVAGLRAAVGDFDAGFWVTAPDFGDAFARVVLVAVAFAVEVFDDVEDLARVVFEAGAVVFAAEALLVAALAVALFVAGFFAVGFLEVDFLADALAGV